MGFWAMFLLLLRRLFPMRTNPVLNFMLSILIFKAAHRIRPHPESQASSVAAARSLGLIEEGVRDETPPEAAAGEQQPLATYRTTHPQLDEEAMQGFEENFAKYRAMVEILGYLGEHSPSVGRQLMRFFSEAVPGEIRRLTTDELEMMQETEPPQSGSDVRATTPADHVVINIPDPAPETEPPSSPVIVGSGTEPRAAQIGDRIRREIEITVVPPFNPLPFMPASRNVPRSFYFTGESSAVGARRAAKEKE